MNLSRRFVTLMLLVLFAIVANRANAIEIVFTINSQSSSITGNVITNLGTVVPQATGSNHTTAVGHFLVDVDNPANPSTITFLGGNGFETLANTLNGQNFQPDNEPANVALKVPSSPFGTVYGAARNLAWDFNSSATAVAPNGSFSAPTLNATGLAGEYDTSLGSANITGSVGSVTGASGNLTSAAGVLTLSLNGSIFNPIVNEFGFTASGSIGGNVIASASFSAGNVTTLIDPSTPVSVLGGASQVGGVAAQFSPGTTAGGTFSAQVIPLAGLPYQSLSGLTAFNVGSSPQAWNVEYTGGTYSGPITLTFGYDPSLLSPFLQANPQDITIEHFNTVTQSWENLGGVLGPGNTITVTTNSLSPFVVAQAVPEPSTFALAGLGLVGLGLAARRKRNRAA